MRDNVTHYTSLTNLFLSMKGINTVDISHKCAGKPRIRTPVYAPGYPKKNSIGVVIAYEESSDIDSPTAYEEPEYFDEKEEDLTAEEDMDKFSDEETKES